MKLRIWCFALLARSRRIQMVGGERHLVTPLEG